MGCSEIAALTHGSEVVSIQFPCQQVTRGGEHSVQDAAGFPKIRAMVLYLSSSATREALGR
jgi:hypothetical protein